MGEYGLVHSRLVFRIILRFPILSTILLAQENCIEATRTAQEKPYSILAERRVLEPLAQNMSLEANRPYKLGERVLIYSELKEKQNGSQTMFGAEGKTTKLKNKMNSI